MPTDPLQIDNPEGVRTRLGEPERTIGGEHCWSITRVAQAFQVRRTTVQNWVTWGQIELAHYDSGKWWIPERVLRFVAEFGPAPRGRYPGHRARNFVRGYASARKAVADPRRPKGSRP